MSIAVNFQLGFSVSRKIGIHPDPVPKSIPLITADCCPLNELLFDGILKCLLIRSQSSSVSGRGIKVFGVTFNSRDPKNAISKMYWMGLPVLSSKIIRFNSASLSVCVF